ncbi:hypothetical protein CRUP_034067 [Coryphaenoides rupestris]|nr:hypothetical protein CRUP_034067 [Coryphaenoides rupestris]
MLSGVVAVASRLGALSLMPPAATTTRRFASRDAKAWTKPNGFGRRDPGRERPAQHHDVFDEDATMEDVEGVEEKLDALLRYLRRERPEEWTVERLAEGFSVPPDDILRVLKSKFTSTALRKVKQDATVMARLGQQTAQPLANRAPQSKPLLLPAQKTPAMLEDGTSGPSALICSATLTPTPRGGGVGGREAEISRTQSRGGPVSLATRPNQVSLSTATQICRPTLAISISEEDHRGAPPVESGDDDEEEEEWDGEVLTENELEELMLTTKPSAAVQVGKDFFDAEGNFLYRI